MARQSQIKGFTDADTTRIAERVAYYAEQHRSVEETLVSPQRERVLAAIAAEESRRADELYRILVLQRGGAAEVEQALLGEHPQPNPGRGPEKMHKVG